MVQAVTRSEQISRTSIFNERDLELAQMASKMPRPIEGNPPYLMEKATGYVHPYTAQMAERSDLVVACYTVDGSFDPEDADPDYDPSGVKAQIEYSRRLGNVPPQSVAELKAQQVAEAKKQKKMPPKDDRKKKIESEVPVQATAPVEEIEQPDLPFIGDNPDTELNAALNEALNGG